ncbi:hypothetical protein BH09VER1_BH09VER1_50650 [soil metagenome]
MNEKKAEDEMNPEEDQPEKTGLGGGIGIFLAQGLAQGGMMPPILAAPPAVVEGQAGAEFSLSDEKSAEEEGDKREA